jgi:hypothetical protein
MYWPLQQDRSDRSDHPLSLFLFTSYDTTTTASITMRTTMNMTRFAYGANYDYTRIPGRKVSTLVLDKFRSTYPHR